MCSSTPAWGRFEAVQPNWNRNRDSSSTPISRDFVERRTEAEMLGLQQLVDLLFFSSSFLEQTHTHTPLSMCSKCSATAAICPFPLHIIIGHLVSAIPFSFTFSRPLPSLNRLESLSHSPTSRFRSTIRSYHPKLNTSIEGCLSILRLHPRAGPLPVFSHRPFPLGWNPCGTHR